MGRAGISLIDVEKAALQLQGRGKSPTVDGIREILGTGSKSTIAQHLRTWKTQQPIGRSNLPQDLLALVTGLWEKLSSSAEQRIIEAENTNQQEVIKLKQALSSVYEDFNHIKIQFHQCEESRTAERTAKEALEKQLIAIQADNVKLQERYQSAFQQLQDNKTENTRLHQLANNIQANLEHYQNAIQQSRTEQALAIEKQQIQSQQEIADLKKDLLLSQRQAREFELQLGQKLLEFQQLEKRYCLLEEDSTMLLKDNKRNDHSLITLNERCDQYAKMLGAREQELESKDKKTQEMEKKIAVLAEQAAQFQKNFLQAEERVETLRHEKLFLVQEKYELQGYLKQLERKNEKQLDRSSING